MVLLVRIFIIGATGVIGRVMVPMALVAGHTVIGMTRSPQRAAELDAAGATGVAVDADDAAALRAAIMAARPDAVANQLTDLPDILDPGTAARSFERTGRLRRDVAPRIVEAALAAGARRVVAQSLAFVYAPGSSPFRETDPLDVGGQQRVIVEGVVALETSATATEGIEGVVLRYGSLYGPGTWYGAPGDPPTLHVDAAAHAALLALEHGAPGIYNIADDDGSVSIEKARAELGFDPAFRWASAIG